MIAEVERYKRLLTTSFEMDDTQAVDIILAVAASHKLRWSEMLWLRVIGSSGSGKTELLRTLAAQEEYCTKMESVTAGAIRRGFVQKGEGSTRQKLLERLNGKLVITKEFASMLTKDMEAQKEIFGLLRSVYDGELDADYGSEQGHLHQESHFDWIIGSTPYLDKVRSLEYLLGSRYIDLQWANPKNLESTVIKAMENDGNLDIIRAELAVAMADLLNVVKEVPKVQLAYIPALATIAATLRSPVERNSRTMEIIDLPQAEVPTRMSQALSRIARGLLMLGVEECDLKPFMVRVVMDSMMRIRASVVKAWMRGVTKQAEIAGRLGVSQGAVSRIVEDINVLGFHESWLDTLNG